MPAYNHTKPGVVEATNDHIALHHSGDFFCELCGDDYSKYIGRSTLEVQIHFEDVHAFTFEDPTRAHQQAEGYEVSDI